MREASYGDDIFVLYTTKKGVNEWKKFINEREMQDFFDENTGKIKRVEHAFKIKSFELINVGKYWKS